MVAARRPLRKGEVGAGEAQSPVQKMAAPLTGR
jgi:hypothetical protein